MLNLRSPLILLAPVAGLVLAALAWFVFGGAGPLVRPLAAAEVRLGAAAPGTAPSFALAPAMVARIANAPLFFLTTGPNAVSEPAIDLLGVAITPGHSAALISVGGKPATWMQVGHAEDGVTVMAVHASSVTVDTPVQAKDVPLGARASTASSTAPAAASPTPSSQSIPPGTRLPPPPADAPRH